MLFWGRWLFSTPSLFTSRGRAAMELLKPLDIRSFILREHDFPMSLLNRTHANFNSKEVGAEVSSKH